MLGIALGLTMAVSFALADFLGGVASKSGHPTAVTAFSRLASLPIIVILSLVFPPSEVKAIDLLWGAASGVSIMIAFRLLYGVLARGLMGVTAALTGLLSALVPLTWSLTLNDESVTVVGGAGMALALASIVVVTAQRPSDGQTTKHRKDVAQGALAGVFFGLSFACMGNAQADAKFVPLAVAQVVTVLMAFGSLVVTRDPIRLPVETFRIVLFSGAFAALGAVAWVLSVQQGVASVTSVLQGTAPVFIALLARLTLGQILTSTQLLGLVLAVTGAVLLAF